MITLRKWGGRFYYPHGDYFDDFLLYSDGIEIQSMYLRRYHDIRQGQEIITYKISWNGIWDNTAKNFLGCGSVAHFVKTLKEAKEVVSKMIEFGEQKFGHIWPKGCGS